MRVFVSTVLRGTPAGKAGELLSLDWESKRILKRVPIVATNPTLSDPNPRGGKRGARGIVLLKDELFVAAYHSLLGFDFDLNPTRRIDHPQFSGLHELKAVEDGIWTTSTSTGVAIKVGFDGKELQSWWAEDDPVVQKTFHPPASGVDKSKDNRQMDTVSKVHLNSIDVHGSRVYVTLNNYGAVLRLFPTEVVTHYPEFKSCHNGLVTNDGELVLNHSHGHTIVVFDAQTGQIKRRINLGEFPEVAALVQKVKYQDVPLSLRLRYFITRRKMVWSLFTRGMCLLDDSRVLVGVAPATVLEVDYKRGKLLGMFQISDCMNVCIHGLEAAPAVDYPHEIGKPNAAAVGASNHA